MLASRVGSDRRAQSRPLRECNPAPATATCCPGERVETLSQICRLAAAVRNERAADRAQPSGVGPDDGDPGLTRSVPAIVTGSPRSDEVNSPKTTSRVNTTVQTTMLTASR